MLFANGGVALTGERLLCTQEDGGSNPLTSIRDVRQRCSCLRFLLLSETDPRFMNGELPRLVSVGFVPTRFSPRRTYR